MDKSDALYIHVPFCDGKCAYCAFYSELYTPSRAAAYLDALSRELALRLSADGVRAFETVYIGGGTPTVLDEDELAHLCRLVPSPLADGAPREWTVEANPGTLTPGKIHVLKEAGVSRISLGAQALRDDELVRLGRRHTVDDLYHGLDDLRAAGLRDLSMDLIACLPDTDGPSWTRTLKEAADLDLPHISIYALTLEPGTRLARDVSSGAVRAPTEAAELDAIDEAERVLVAAGYERYEISNYARPGHRCRHNMRYWLGRDYLGLGPAAASRQGRSRWTNHPDVTRYAAALADDRLPPRDREALSEVTDVTERVVFSLRLSDGLCLGDFPDARPEWTASWETSLELLTGEGLTVHDGDRWKLTARGRQLADHVIGELMLPGE